MIAFPFAGQAASLLFPSSGDIRTLIVNGNGTGSYDAIAHSQASTGALGVSWEKQLVFWTDLRQGTIKRARIPSMTSVISILPHNKQSFFAVITACCVCNPDAAVRPTINDSPTFFSFTFHRDYYRLISVVVSYQLIMRILRSEFNFDITLRWLPIIF